MPNREPGSQSPSDPERPSAGIGLAEVLTAPEGQSRLKVSDVVDRAGDRSIGFALALTAIPAMVPFLPPGASAAVGLMVIVVAMQLLLGVRRLLLPGWVRRYAFSERATAALHSHAGRWDNRLSKLTRPRMGAFAGRKASIVAALPLIGAGVVLFLPIPFMNTLPAVGILMTGIGFSNRDGLFVLLGAGLCGGIIGFLAMMPSLVVDGLKWLT